MKLGPVTKLNKGNKKTSKKFDHVMSNYYDVIAIFPFYSQFEAIRKTIPGVLSGITYLFINSELLSYKTKNN